MNALDEMKKEAAAMGAIGVGCRLRLSEIEILADLMDILNLSMAEAESYLKLSKDIDGLWSRDE